jgi:uncharacterized FlgJ-related protein
MSQRRQATNFATCTQAHDTQKAKSHKGKERMFFQQMQPTFAVDVPNKVTRLEFLDESNPAKSTIVRKKAREWVNQNKANIKKSRQKQQIPKEENDSRVVQSIQKHDMQLQGWTFHDMAVTSVPLPAIGHVFDPFNSLPDVGTKYDHILDYCESLTSL